MDWDQPGMEESAGRQTVLNMRMTDVRGTEKNFMDVRVKLRCCKECQETLSAPSFQPWPGAAWHLILSDRVVEVKNKIKNMDCSMWQFKVKNCECE